MSQWAGYGLLFLGIALFAGFLIIQFGSARYDSGFSSGSNQAVIACKTEADKADATATKTTKQIIAVSRSASRVDDVKWLSDRGLYSE